uniref:Putative Exodeoxyribonuclease III n=1 Tax=Magnetococcus massalia (strain MO-1) TaxID=451514 RepID=A0A1S7LEL9_MAGMO|nr:putative Exodeoxyribonuclease III [Candidatus Magnetococcus massalia]
MRIATWNVNSLNVRQDHVVQWLAQDPCDILCLQETKMVDAKFPTQRFEELGWHLCMRGQKTYNGVAIFSKAPIAEQDLILDLPAANPEQKRFIAATIGDTRVVNVYVPNGAEVESDKYHYKLEWLEKLIAFIQDEMTRHPNLILLGDYNIAPEDRDLYDPAAWQGRILTSKPERDAFERLCALGLTDAFRQLNDHEGHYSWWDYRQGAFRRGMGIRIDHLLISQPLSARLSQCTIDKTPRGWERPSDHAPVIATFS